MLKTFKQITTSENILMIVDALNMCFSFRGKHDFAEDYVNMVNSLKRSYRASQVIIACDKGSSTFRKSIYPEYKQNRKDKFDKQTDAEKLEFELFFKEFERALELIKQETEYPILRFQGCEADDIVGYIINNRKHLNYEHIWLISSDRDYDLLVKPDVSRFSYITRKEITWDNWGEHYDFDPEEYISIKCLTGDAGDNIMGIPSIGPKRALDLVKEYGSAFDITDAAPIPGKYKYIQSLNENIDTLSLNYQLMDIETFCADALGTENCNHIREVLGV
jgi:5'-3' exonuclease